MFFTDQESGIRSFGREEIGCYYQDAGGSFVTTEVLNPFEFEMAGDLSFSNVTYKGKPIDDYLVEEISTEEFWDACEALDRPAM